MSDAARTYIRVIQGLFAACLLFTGAHYLNVPQHVIADMPTLGRIQKYERAQAAAAEETAAETEAKPEAFAGALPNKTDTTSRYEQSKVIVAWVFVGLGFVCLLLGRNAFLWFLRISLALLFIYAGLQKIIHPDTFAKNISCYLMLPSLWVNPISFALPVLEVIAGAALLLPWTKNAGAILIAGMLLAFVVLTTYALWLGLDVDCGCGSAPHPLTWEKPIKNIIYTLGCGALLFRKDDE